MPNIKRILLPVDFPETSLPVIHQAATLARHFQAEILMMHVATMMSHASGVPEPGSDLAGWDMLAEVIKNAQKNQDKSLDADLAGLAIRRLLVKGDAARAIVQTAEDEGSDLIMMPSHGQTFDHFLLGSVAVKGIQKTECPVWTGAYVEESPPREFAIRSILCAADFNTRDRTTVSWAACMATEFGARLTLAHVTAAVEFWGPGGIYINQKWKEALVEDASQQLAKLQQNLSIKADVFIGSGDVPQVLSQAAKQTKADLLVTGSRPYGGHLRTHGFAIISAVSIPVLSV
jgi:nucleotide-binding universal stress UspA family protein